MQTLVAGQIAGTEPAHRWNKSWTALSSRNPQNKLEKIRQKS
jgi:hypothetical protein